MLKKFLFFVLMIVTVFSFTACANSSQGDVIATVNGEPIYYSDYEYLLSSGFMQYYYNYYNTLSAYYGIDLNDEASASATVGDMEKYYLDALIDNEIVKQLAAEKGIEFEDTWMKDFLDDPSYEQYKVNTLYAELYNIVQDELLETASVSEDEIRSVYEEDPSSWIGRSSSNIVILCDFADDATSAAAYEKALACIAELNNGADFDEMIAKYSDDANGQIGFVNASGSYLDGSGGLVSEYTAAVFGLASVGDYTLEPVASEYGYHIIRLDGILDTFDGVKSYIEDSMVTVTDDQIVAKLDEMITEKKDVSEIEYKKDVYQYYTGEDTTE